MRHSGVSTALAAMGGTVPGPIAVLQADDLVELTSTLDHFSRVGFRTILLMVPVAMDMSGVDVTAPGLHVIDYDPKSTDPLATSVNQVIAAAAGQWIYAGYSGEYLFYPFCETRSVVEMLTFHTEERRTAMLATVVDLYAADLRAAPNGVSRSDAHFDTQGYYALTRKSEADGWAPLDRQLDIYGGLRRRFEEHVPWTRRRIDRIALFQAMPGLRMAADFTLSDPEMNTHASPWHHNLTAAVCSFRTAKALRTNPGSRDVISSFHWQHSAPFRWHSQQLLDLGLMEPGQWF